MPSVPRDLNDRRVSVLIRKKKCGASYRSSANELPADLAAAGVAATIAVAVRLAVAATAVSATATAAAAAAAEDEDEDDPNDVIVVKTHNDSLSLRI